MKSSSVFIFKLEPCVLCSSLHVWSIYCEYVPSNYCVLCACARAGGNDLVTTWCIEGWMLFYYVWHNQHFMTFDGICFIPLSLHWNMNQHVHSAEAVSNWEQIHHIRISRETLLHRNPNSWQVLENRKLPFCRRQLQPLRAVFRGLESLRSSRVALKARGLKQLDLAALLAGGRHDAGDCAQDFAKRLTW